MEGQPQPHVKCGIDIWTAPYLLLLFHYTCYLAASLYLILYVISSPFIRSFAIFSFIFSSSFYQSLSASCVLLLFPLCPLVASSLDLCLVLCINTSRVKVFHSNTWYPNISFKYLVVICLYLKAFRVRGTLVSHHVSYKRLLVG